MKYTNPSKKPAPASEPLVVKALAKFFKFNVGGVTTVDQFIEQLVTHKHREIPGAPWGSLSLFPYKQPLSLGQGFDLNSSLLGQEFSESREAGYLVQDSITSGVPGIFVVLGVLHLSHVNLLFPRHIKPLLIFPRTEDRVGVTIGRLDGFRLTET